MKTAFTFYDCFLFGGSLVLGIVGCFIACNLAINQVSGIRPFIAVNMSALFFAFALRKFLQGIQINK